MTEAPLVALETAMPHGGVAVGQRGRVLAEVGLGVRTRHSESLLPALRFALERARLRVTDVGGVVVGGGPGSFTGVRIAAAAAKGLSHALGVPLYAYSTLLAVAAAAAQDERAVCALLDARRGEVYAAVYRFPAFQRVETLAAPAVRHVTAVAADVAELRPIFVGEGAERYAEVVRTVGPVVPAGLAGSAAAALLWLADRDPEAGRVAEPAHWEPEYLRESGAERRA